MTTDRLADLRREFDHLLKGFNPTSPPATVEELASAERELDITIPEDLALFLMTRGGGEGFVRDGYLRIRPPTEWPEANSTLQTRAERPTLVLFGSDGSNTKYGLDRTTHEYFRVESIGDLEPHPMGRSFLEFLRSVAELGSA